jgi:hypothetical protein
MDRMQGVVKPHPKSPEAVLLASAGYVKPAGYCSSPPACGRVARIVKRMLSYKGCFSSSNQKIISQNFILSS